MSELNIFNGIVEQLNLPGNSAGKLAGKTFVAKDNFDVAGYRTGAGQPDWKRTHEAAVQTASAITTILEAGASLVGKSSMDELAFSLDGINVHYGIPSNPNMPGYIPGGSSSGSASAVSAKLCDFALGTDTLGSVRVPSAFCGIFGMRPTHGRISVAGVIPLGPSFDTVGWLARDCGVFLQCGEALLNQPASSAKLPQIRILANCLDLMPEGLRRSFESAVGALGLGLELNPKLTLAPGSLQNWLEVFDKIRSWEAWRYFGNWMDDVNPQMQELMKNRFLSCRNVSEADKNSAEMGREKIMKFLDETLSEQIICMPTTFDWPASCEASAEELAMRRKQNSLINVIASVGGLPQVSIPISLPDSSAKFGVSFIAKAGADSVLLSLAKDLASLPDLGIGSDWQS